MDIQFLFLFVDSILISFDHIFPVSKMKTTKYKINEDDDNDVGDNDSDDHDDDHHH